MILRTSKTLFSITAITYIALTPAPANASSFKSGYVNGYKSSCKQQGNPAPLCTFVARCIAKDDKFMNSLESKMREYYKSGDSEMESARKAYANPKVASLFKSRLGKCHKEAEQRFSGK